MEKQQQFRMVISWPPFHYQSKASASNSAFDFESSSTTTPDDGSNSNTQEDDDATKLDPSLNLDAHQPPLQQSDSDSESSVGDHVNPFVLLEIHNNVLYTMDKVSSVETSVAELKKYQDLSQNLMPIFSLSPNSPDHQ